MKRRSLFSAGFALALAPVFGVLTAAEDKNVSMKGWISDTHCGAKGMTAEHKDCAEKCVKGMGAKFVFVDSDKKVVQIHNQDAVKDTDPGHPVTVTGHLMEDNSLHIDRIEAGS